MNSALFSSLSISTRIIRLIPTVILLLICNTPVKQQDFHMLPFKHVIIHVWAIFSSFKLITLNLNYNLGSTRRRQTLTTAQFKKNTVCFVITQNAV